VGTGEQCVGLSLDGSVLASSADNTIRELFVGTRSDMRWLSPYSNPARLSLDSAARLPSELCTLKLWRMRLWAGGRSVGSGCGVTLPVAPAAGIARAAGQAEGLALRSLHGTTPVMWKSHSALHVTEWESFMSNTSAPAA
jgi:hypothetical protein